MAKKQNGQQGQNQQTNNNSNFNDLGRKLDELNRSINDLVDTLEDMSTEGKKSGNGRNPHIRPGSFFGEEWKDYYRGDRSKNSYKKYRKEAEDYIERGERRDNLYRELRRSRFGETKFGQYISSLNSRSQTIDNYGMAGNYMVKNAKSIGTGLFGNNKWGEAATKAVGGFGKAISGASKLLGGPWVTAILAGIDAFKKIGQTVSELLTHLANAQALGLESSAQINQLQFQQQKETTLANINLQTEGVKYQGDLQVKMLDAQSQIMLNALKLQTDQYVKSIGIALGPILEGINETAYRAAESAVDFAATSQKNENLQTSLLGQYKNFETARTIDWENQQDITKANINLLNQQTQAGILEAGQQLQFDLNDSPWLRQVRSEQSLYDDKNVQSARNKYREATGIDVMSTSDAIREYRKKVGEEFQGFDVDEDILESLTRRMGLFRASKESKERVQKAGLQIENMTSLHPAEMEAALKQATSSYASTVASYTQQLGDKQLEIEKEKKDIIVDAAAEIQKTWLKLAQATEKWTEKFEELTNDFAKNRGYTNLRQMRDFQYTMFQTGLDAARFGKTTEDAVKMQSQFIEGTGRNRLFDGHDNRQMFALGQYLGDDGLAASYASNMEIFNVGVADSVDMLDDALQDVNRMGLNGRKYTKTLVDNLKLANKFSFKEGTKSLMNMAKWAENTRFNLNSLGGMLDKVQEGGLENVITMGAQFQVLGGHAAMNADPIAMMFEAFSDPDAYAKRMQDMTIGYGQLDRKTGETKFGGDEVMLMRQIAKIQGRSVEEVMDEVRARNKKEVVAKQLSSNFDEEQQAFISNLAEYNKENGRFEVKVKRGNHYETEDISNLTKEDLDKLMPEKHNERMEDYMQTLVTLVGRMAGEEESERIMLGEKTFDNTIEQYNERLRKARESFAKNFEEYVKQTKDGQYLATTSFSNFIEIFQNGNPEVDEEVKKLKKTASSINTVLGETANIIAEANAKIRSALNLDVDIQPKKDNNSIIDVNEFKKQQEEYNNIRKKYGPDLSPNSLKMAQNYENRFNGELIVPEKYKKNNANDFITKGSVQVLSNDGLVQAHPDDVGIFAKNGGPISNFLEDFKMIGNSNGNNTIHFDTLKIDGKLELSSNGQSVNVIEIIKNDPLIMRELSRMIATNVSKAFNGGRGTSIFEQNYSTT